LGNGSQYSLITESPGIGATKEQMERLYQRYHFALSYASGKDVLEVACGTGIGLSYLALKARRVVGCDIDEKNLGLAKTYNRSYDGMIWIDLMDAHDLSYQDESFDLVLLYEAIYYLKEPEQFIKEARRVLRENGTLIICSVNKDWQDFHPSPYTWKYYSIPELHDLMRKYYRKVSVYGGFHVESFKIRDSVISLIKHLALRYHLIPGSLKARSYLKRIFIGKLMPLPSHIYEGMASYQVPIPIRNDHINKDFKIIYYIAKKS
jgi:ubiquinone/menaquinone biosynthesis C-methylase UbiE